MVEFYFLRYLQMTRKNGALRSYGQVEWMEEEILLKNVLLWLPQGRWKGGRPVYKWKTHITSISEGQVWKIRTEEHNSGKRRRPNHERMPWRRICAFVVLTLQFSWKWYRQYHETVKPHLIFKTLYREKPQKGQNLTLCSLLLIIEFEHWVETLNWGTLNEGFTVLEHRNCVGMTSVAIYRGGPKILLWFKVNFFWKCCVRY